MQKGGIYWVGFYFKIYERSNKIIVKLNKKSIFLKLVKDGLVFNLLLEGDKIILRSYIVLNEICISKD